ncbi:hypothetical protein Tco_1434289 [Tanacetum coccineum]
MSIQSEPVIEEEEDDEQPAQNPPAPSDELFEFSTHYSDPLSYVISLIRKLLPPTMNATTTSESVTGCDVTTQGTNDVATNGSKCETMDVNDDTRSPPHRHRSNEQEEKNDDSSVEKKMWVPQLEMILGKSMDAYYGI